MHKKKYKKPPKNQYEKKLKKRSIYLLQGKGIKILQRMQQN